jgi:hypothetical protein
LRQPRAVVVTPPCLRKKATGGVALRPEGVRAELGWAKEEGKEGGRWAAGNWARLHRWIEEKESRGFIYKTL